MSSPLYSYPFRKNEFRVIDGDSIKATLDKGWNDYKITNIRLLGLNAPEKRTRRLLEKQTGLLVRDLITKWFNDRKGKHFYGSSEERPKYFGRTVGRVWADSIDDCLNQYLLDLKVVKPYSGGKREPFTDEELNTISEICKKELS